MLLEILAALAWFGGAVGLALIVYRLVRSILRPFDKRAPELKQRDPGPFSNRFKEKY